MVHLHTGTILDSGHQRKLMMHSGRQVQFLFEHGFRFQKVYLKQGDMWTRKRYPGTLEEAKDFIERFADQAVPVDQIKDDG